MGKHSAGEESGAIAKPEHLARDPEMPRLSGAETFHGCCRGLSAPFFIFVPTLLS